MWYSGWLTSNETNIDNDTHVRLLTTVGTLNQPSLRRYKTTTTVVWLIGPQVRLRSSTSSHRLYLGDELERRDSTRDVRKWSLVVPSMTKKPLFCILYRMNWSMDNTTNIQTKGWRWEFDIRSGPVSNVKSVERGDDRIIGVSGSHYLRRQKKRRHGEQGYFLWATYPLYITDTIN